jgi:TetR/AcrR family transcriptional repressor of nem operon
MARYDATQKEDTRRKILRAASREFREKGVRATTVPGVMESAGMTVGGFYKHFDSKEDLFRQALTEAVSGTSRLMQMVPEDLTGDAWKRAIADVYLSEMHRDNVKTGCALAALSGDVTRSDRETREVYEAGLEQMIDQFRTKLGVDHETARAEAWQFLAQLLGTLILSRAVASPSTSREILEASRDAAAD